MQSAASNHKEIFIEINLRAMATLNLVSSNLNINVVFPQPGSNNINLTGFRSGGGRLEVRRRKPSLGTVKCLDATTSLAPLRTNKSSTTRVPLESIPEGEITSIKRDYFPRHFKFGASSSALQSEGNLTVGGRGPSTNDYMVLADQGYNGADSYNLYLEDVKSLKDMGMTAYRFSISWTRILPKGNLHGGINQEGIDFYNKLINALIENGISPYVTLCHFEIPQALADSYSSLLSKQIIFDFKDYADVCFKNFGDRVKHWMTFNEPYNLSAYMWRTSTGPNPEDGAFTATHNVILAHAYAVAHYRTHYKPKYGGEIGISLAFNWVKPFSSRLEDKAAAQHARDHEFGWYMNPLTFGEYPKTMRDEIPELPHFNDDEAKLVQGSIDFLGLNYYSTSYAQPAENWTVDNSKGGLVQLKYVNEGGCTDILGYPEGFREMLLYVKRKYENPTIFITENGWAETQVYTTSLQEALATGKTDILIKALIDDKRLHFIINHLIALLEAQREGVNVTGFCVWSLMDSMEPGQGYNKRMGLVFTDYFDHCKRYPKISAKWFSKFLNPVNSSVEYKPVHPLELDSQ